MCVQFRVLFNMWGVNTRVCLGDKKQRPLFGYGTGGKYP